jgi:hypothetical protein
MIRLDLTRIIHSAVVRFLFQESCKISAGIFQSESYEIFKKKKHIRSYWIVLYDHIKNLVRVRSFKILYGLTSDFLTWVIALQDL